MKCVGLGYITRLSGYAELLHPRIQAPLPRSRSLGVRAAFQLEGVSQPDHKPATQCGSLATKERLRTGEGNSQAKTDKCSQGKDQIRLEKATLHYCGYRGVHQRSGLRGRTSTALDHSLVLPVCATKPEVVFTRADLYCSGPHVDTTSLQRRSTLNLI